MVESTDTGHGIFQNGLQITQKKRFQAAGRFSQDLTVKGGGAINLIQLNYKHILFFILFQMMVGGLFGCAAKTQPAKPPETPFVSDGCSCFPDGDYYDCCLAHDRDYWWGGTAAERKASDLRLKKCIAEKGHGILAPFMYYSVRVFGHGWLPTPFRWGFGRKWPHGYYAEDNSTSTGDKMADETVFNGDLPDR